MTFKTYLTILATFTTAITTPALAETVVATAEGSIHSLSESMTREANAAIDRAEKWLLKNQQPGGNWSNPEFPAMTAFPVWALAMDGKMDAAAQKKAVDFILKATHPNGAIFVTPKEARKGGGLPNYNTAISMIALNYLKDPGLNPTILKARKFLATGQHAGSDEYKGGFGYDSSTGRAYTDLSNTYIAAEAMALTAAIEDLRQNINEKATIDNKALADYVFSLQQEDGGIRYHPNKSMASSDEENAARQFRSYGSMTYAGLLTLIYADVDRTDPRVRSAFDWAANHWSLEENPGMGGEGLYYFYNVLAKALAAMDRDIITLESGKTINWRNELVHKLINLQKVDADGTGYWLNPQSRWFEADPVLVTCYTLIALKTAMN